LSFRSNKLRFSFIYKERFNSQVKVVLIIHLITLLFFDIIRIMNILTFSDNHGSLPRIPKKYRGNNDVLIFLCGDICPNNIKNFIPGIRKNGVFESTSWDTVWNFRKIDFEKEREFQNNWIETALLPHFKNNDIQLSQIIGVAGNHDWANFSKYFENMIETNSKTITIQETKIGLLCGCNFFTGEWQDEISEEETKLRIKNIDSDINILISHQPPYNILDLGLNYCKCGSQAIYTSIFGRSVFDDVKPYFSDLQLHVFGHLHGNHGTKSFLVNNRKIRFYNSAQKYFDLNFPFEDD